MAKVHVENCCELKVENRQSIDIRAIEWHLQVFLKRIRLSVFHVMSIREDGNLVTFICNMIRQLSSTLLLSCGYFSFLYKKDLILY